MNKKEKRLKRAIKTRAKIKSLEANRLVVFRSNQHTYAQIIFSGKTLVSASTLEISSDALPCKSNINAATAVGKLIAERAMAKGIKKVAFDRAGFLYHGRIKALADSARQVGLEF